MNFAFCKCYCHPFPFMYCFPTFIPIKTIRNIDSKCDINEYDIRDTCIICWEELSKCMPFYECYNCNVKFHTSCYHHPSNKKYVHTGVCCHCQKLDTIFLSKRN